MVIFREDLLDGPTILGKSQRGGASKPGFGGLRKPLRKMTGLEPKREGGNRIIGGGGVSKTAFGKGFCGVFSPPLTFPRPLFFSEQNRDIHKNHLSTKLGFLEPPALAA